MNFSFDNSLSSQQRAWAQDAIALCRFPWDAYDLNVTFVVVPEPPCPGHQDYMCTQADVGFANFLVNIREGADDPTQQFNKGLPNPAADVKDFYMESIIHELGHVIVDKKVDGAGRIAETVLLFTMQKTGAGIRTGTEADWNDPPEWADHIQEAAAEVFKDTFLNENYRVYENRTNWDISEADHKSFIEILTAANRSFEDHKWLDLGPAFYAAPQIIYEGDPYPAHQDYKDDGEYPVDGSGQTFGIGGIVTIAAGGAGYPGPTYFDLDDPWRPPTHPEVFSGYVPRDPDDWNGQLTCEFESVISPAVRAMGGLDADRMAGVSDKLLVELWFGGNYIPVYGSDYTPFGSDAFRFATMLPNVREMMQFMRDNGYTVPFDLRVHWYGEPGDFAWPDNSLPGGDNLPFAFTWTGTNVSAGDAPYPYSDPVVSLDQGPHQVQRMGPTTIR